MKQGEVWLVGCDIAEYVKAHQFNHEPRRPRKLLMHRREIKKFANLAFEKGLTLVPLKMYFKEGRAKVLMGICRGRKLYDKREQLKKNDHETRHRPCHAPQLSRSATVAGAPSAFSKRSGNVPAVRFGSDPLPPSDAFSVGRFHQAPPLSAELPAPIRVPLLGACQPLDEDANSGIINCFD